MRNVTKKMPSFRTLASGARNRPETGGAKAVTGRLPVTKHPSRFIHFHPYGYGRRACRIRAAARQKRFARTSPSLRGKVMQRANVFTIASGAPFLKTFASSLFDGRVVEGFSKN